MPYNTRDPNASHISTQQMVAKNEYPGFWKGRVEYNKDPLQMGRIKVRVWELHGVQKAVLADGSFRGISIEALPWARPMWGMGGGGGAYDTGSFDVPPVGANVWLFYERNNPDAPVYLGTYNEIAGYETELITEKTGTSTVETTEVFCKDENEDNYGRKYGTVYSRWREKELPIQPPSMETWYGPPGPQMPLESQEMVDHDPTIHVYYKTAKGASLYCEEADEKEYTQLLDRCGQGLRIEGFVKADDNLRNAEQRGLRSVFRGDQIERAKTLNEETIIMLADILNQGMLISSRKGEERIKLISKDGDEGTSAMESGLDRQELELNAGHKETVIRGVIDGKTETLIRAESSKGLITIDTDQRVIIRTGKTIIDAKSGGCTIYGNVTIHGNLSVTGSSRFIGPSIHVGHLVASSGCTGCGALGIF